MPAADTNTHEIWKAIPGYENRYEVSTCGNVRGFLNTRGRPLPRPKYLRLFVNTWGRIRCDLRRDGTTRRFQVHRLVLEAFVGPCPQGQEGSHLDGNHSNNALANLCWETHIENEARKIAHGTSLRGRKMQKVREWKASNERR